MRPGAPDTNRTCDLPLRRGSLYPLSYGGEGRILADSVNILPSPLRVVFLVRILLARAIAVAAAGCGVDTLSAAATVAAAKKKELEEGKKTMEKAKQDIEKATELTRKNLEKADEPEK